MDSGIRVLVADDMPAIRGIVRGMLKDIGFTAVTEVEDGDAAWEALQRAAGDPKEAFSLVLADWQMPGMTGIDLLRAIRATPQMRETPFIMMTAKGDEANLREASRAGASEYLVKPFNRALLAEKIARFFPLA